MDVSKYSSSTGKSEKWSWVVLKKGINIDNNVFVSEQHFKKSLIKRWNKTLKNRKVSYAMKEGIMCFKKPNLKNES